MRGGGGGAGGGGVGGVGGRTIPWGGALVAAVPSLKDGPGGLRAAGMCEPADAVEQPKPHTLSCSVALTASVCRDRGARHPMPRMPGHRAPHKNEPLLHTAQIPDVRLPPWSCPVPCWPCS